MESIRWIIHQKKKVRRDCYFSPDVRLCKEERRVGALSDSFWGSPSGTCLWARENKLMGHSFYF